MKFNIILNKIVCILFAISFIFFACSDITEGNYMLNQDPPRNIRVTVNSTSSITISWNSVSDASGYYIYRSTGAYGTYTQIGYSYSTSYTDNSLSSSTTYYYKVAAYNSSGTGIQSSYNYATTQTNSSSSTRTNSSSSAQSNSSSSIRTNSSSSTQSNTYSATYLSTNTWHSNTLSAGTVHYYQVYLTFGIWYVKWEDYDNSSYTADIKVGVRIDGNSGYVVDVTDNSSTNQIQFLVSSTGYYIIEVHGYSDSSSGSYRVMVSN